MFINIPDLKLLGLLRLRVSSRITACESELYNVDKGGMVYEPIFNVSRDQLTVAQYGGAKSQNIVDSARKP